MTRFVLDSMRLRQEIYALDLEFKDTMYNVVESVFEQKAISRKDYDDEIAAAEYRASLEDSITKEYRSRQRDIVKYKETQKKYMEEEMKFALQQTKECEFIQSTKRRHLQSLSRFSR